METKHTKGEWKIDPYNKYSIIDSTTSGFEALVAQANGKKEEERIANAKLIAAAPELLEALIESREQIKHMFNMIDNTKKNRFKTSTTSMLMQINKVIKKATE